MVVDIIGGGIGGLTLGIALKQKGISVRIFEQAAIIKEIGAGIVLASNAMQVYKYLGLSDEISKLGNSISTINITDHQLKVISKTRLTAFEKEYKLKNIAIHRGALQQVLAKQFNQNELFLDHQLVHIKENFTHKLLEFGNGKVYKSAVVIGADGLFSKVRELLFPSVTIRNAKQVCWRGVLKYNLQNNNTAIEAWGKGSRFGFVQIDSEKVYWYAVQSIKNTTYVLPPKLDKSLFLDYNPQVLALINSTDEAQIHTAFLQDILPFKNWSIGRVCLLGDAAHATTPNMGQGACQAIEDAYVLASFLDKFDVDKAFALFEKKRIAKAHKIVKTSFVIGKVSQSSNKILVFLRNRLLKLIPPQIHKKQMQFIFKIATLKNDKE